MTNTINSKRFVIRKSLIGKNTTINVEFKMAKLALIIMIKFMKL